MTEKTTEQVATELGKNKKSLIVTLQRHPHLKPAKSFGQNFMWTRGEIDRLAAHYGSAKPGRPAK